MITIMSGDLLSTLTHMAGTRRDLAEGDRLFLLGDPVRFLYVVLAGRVELMRYREDGGRVVLQRAGPGMVLAEASLFSNAYHCDAYATAASSILALRKTEVRKRLAEDRSFSGLFTAHLAREVQQARLRSEILATRTVADRLESWLAMDDGAADRQVSWKSVAEEIGVSPEALYRELARRRRRPLN